MAPNIRPARQEDAPGITEAHVRAIRETALLAYPAGHVEAWAKPVSEAGHRQGVESGIYFVAEVGGRIAGFATLTLDPPKLGLLYVHPEFGRRGIGLLLTLRVLDEARTRGLKEVLTEASLLSKPVCERAGFIPSGGCEREMVGLKFICFQMRFPISQT
jgi:putative acetyltransferase